MTFKVYTIEQPSLLLLDLRKLIPEDHLVRVVNRVVDEIELESRLVK